LEICDYLLQHGTCFDIANTTHHMESPTYLPTFVLMANRFQANLVHPDPQSFVFPLVPEENVLNK